MALTIAGAVMLGSSERAVAQSELSMYEITIAANVDDGFTSAEILRDSRVIARVYELPTGWRIELVESGAEPMDALLDAIGRARDSLTHYVNRTGANPPHGLSGPGLSLWLMEKDDGTAMGRPAT